MSSAQARLRPSRPLQFFGVGDAALAGRRFVIDGSRATAVPYQRVALLVRYVDEEAWSNDAIARQRSDPQWLVGQAHVHETVLDRAMARGAVVPAPFLTFYESMAELNERAQQSYDRWRRALARISGKDEWAIHAYLGPHAVPRANPYVLRSAHSRSKTPSIAAYATAEATETIGKLWRACGLFANASRPLDPSALPQHLLSGAFLVQRSRVEGFRAVLERFSANAQSAGLTVYLEGPRPPYSFV